MQRGGTSQQVMTSAPTGFRLGPAPDTSQVSRNPATWNPRVRRIILRQSEAKGTPSAATEETARADNRPAKRKRMEQYRAAHLADEGRDLESGPPVAEPEEVQPTSDVELPTTRDEITVEVRALGPDELDPVADLRDSLGWSGIRDQQQAPKRGTVGLVGSTGRSASSPQTVLPDDFPLSNDVAVSAMATELGAYLHDVDVRIAAAWNETDLPMEDRALGIQGRVTLVLQIRSTGRVSYVHISASSGNSRLDEMARIAIPRRFRAFPKEWRLRESPTVSRCATAIH